MKTAKRICLNCGRVFEIKISRIKTGRGKYCSTECYHNKGRLLRVCQICHQTFLMKKSRVEKGKGVYCSWSCRAEGMRALPKTKPELQRWAINQLNLAFQQGRIKRLPCFVCNNPKTDAHHQDYSKPLEVFWLCREHHQEFHKNLARKAFLCQD